MGMVNKPFIISISANAGGGKTTITRELCNQLNNAKALYFDNYEFAKQPENICEWVENGSDSNEWDLSLLVNDIIKIMKNEQADYIILDYPFGRQNYPVKELIDITVFIETPLDISLARRIIRDYKEANVDEIMNDLSFYLTRSRRCFTEHNEIMKSSNVIVDGSLAVDKIVNIIMKEIKQRIKF
jgi:Uridine kinase